MAWQLAAAAGVQGLGSVAGGIVGANAAGAAAKRADNAMHWGADAMRNARNTSIQETNAGYDQGMQYLGQADGLLQDGQNQLRDTFAQERQLGGSALARLQAVLLGGDMSQLQMDPGYAFRQQQGEKGIQRQANAAGSFGGGANLKDFARFNQDLASQEYGNALQRLMSVGQIGINANQNFAQMNQALIGNRANTYGQMADMGVNRGLATSNLRQTTAANLSNLYQGATAQVNNMNMQQANAVIGGIQGVANAATSYAGGAMHDGYMNKYLSQFGGGK